MKDRLYIEINKNIVGKLTKENSEYLFSYETEEEDDFISLTMPVRTKEYINDHLHPIFEMHLPEGYLLSIIKKHFSKITKTDDFGLLKLISGNINGRITYAHHKEEQKEFLTLHELLQPKSENLFDELISRFALQSALSGVQPKVLATIQDKVTLKLEDYIVKSWGDDYPDLALNEYYCMKIAKYANITVPEFYISNDHKLFIMKRFDILEDGTNLGFEDMCVLQAKQRDDKYEGTYEKISKSIKTFVSPQYKKSSLIQFFKMIIINNLVQNGDAHLKNFGLLYEDIENIKLCPAFDIVSTTIYIQNDIPALTLMGSKKWWGKTYLLQFGTEHCNLGKKEAISLYDECVDAVHKVIDELKKKIAEEKETKKVDFLKKLLKTFSTNTSR